MSRSLAWLNLAGVVLLALLCLWQWRGNRALHLHLASVQVQAAERALKMEELDRHKRGLSADLELFRTQLERASAELRASENRAGRAEQERHQAQALVEELKVQVASWHEAVAARDARLTEANALLQDLNQRLQEAVEQHNALATRYNDTVRLYEELAQRYTAAEASLAAAREKDAVTKP